MYGNCLANTRNLKKMPVSSKNGSQKLRKNSRGHRGRGRGDQRVPEEARRHFRCIQQVLHKCLSPSLAKQKAGWEVRRRRMGEKGRGTLRVEAKARPPGGCPSPGAPAHPPAAQLEPGPGQGSIVQAWLGLGTGKGCCV